MHFLGVGGVSMSALAQYFAQNGAKVTGSDLVDNVKIEGVDTRNSVKLDNIKKADLVIVTNAIQDGDPDLVFAKKHGKKIISRGQLLGFVAQNFDTTIAVSGTHGKTSTTEMIAEILVSAGQNPTVHIGGASGLFGSNFLSGGRKYFVTEACEYGNSFLCLKPDIAVVLNIEKEHLDFFKTFEAENRSFQKFMAQSDAVVANACLGQKANVLFGAGGDFEAKNIQKTNIGFVFDVQKNKKYFCRITLKSFNQKNIENALAAIAVCDMLGIEKKFIKSALKNFCGVKRRMEILSQNPLVIHDYAHHPTEIKNTILSVKSHFQKPVVVAFQPHTYSRTKQLFADFVEAFRLADEVWLLPTYSAREQPECGLPSEAIFEKLAGCMPAHFAQNFAVAKQEILQNLGQKILLILGAGDIEKMW